MKSNKDGFSIPVAFLVILIVGFVSVVGWIVYSRKQVNTTKDTATAHINQPQGSSIKETPETKPVSVLPDNWKKVTENGITISYPKSWDETKEDYQRLKIYGKVDGSVIYVGFGAPVGYQYLGNFKWEYVDSEGTKIDDSKPDYASVGVAGADSTIIVNSGDGGCGGRRIGFVYKGSLYSIGLPWECGTDELGGIPSDIVDKDLEEVIKSIMVQ